jgi:His-Xaa-Ser system protein HxsD
MAATTERVLRLDTRDASTAAIRAAAYRFGDVFSVHLEPVAENVVAARCTFPQDTSQAHVDSTMREFERELNDQILRERVREETKHVRAVILAHAFSRTQLGRDD